jgi:hypothetical protein
LEVPVNIIKEEIKVLQIGRKKNPLSANGIIIHVEYVKVIKNKEIKMQNSWNLPMIKARL